MAYKKTNWKARDGSDLNRFAKSQETSRSVILRNEPNAITAPGTPFSVQNMNNIEQGIDDAHEMIAGEAQDRRAADQGLQQAINAETQERTAADAAIQQIINTLIGLPAWDSDNHIITFTAKDGSTLKVDIPLEDLTQDIDFDPVTKEIILFKKNGAEIRIDVADLVDVYTGSRGTHIQITIGEDNQINAVLRAGSITEAELSAVLLNTIVRTSGSQTIGGVKTFSDIPVLPLNNPTADNQAARKGYVDNQVSTRIPASARGEANGVASLDSDGRVPQNQIPSVPATLNRTIVGNDNASAAITDTGGNIQVPMPATVTAGSGAAVDTPARTNVSLRSLLQDIWNRIFAFANSKVGSLRGNTATSGLIEANGTNSVTTRAISTAARGAHNGTGIVRAGELFRNTDRTLLYVSSVRSSHFGGTNITFQLFVKAKPIVTEQWIELLLVARAAGTAMNLASDRDAVIQTPTGITFVLRSLAGENRPQGTLAGSSASSRAIVWGSLLTNSAIEVRLTDARGTGGGVPREYRYLAHVRGTLSAAVAARLQTGAALTGTQGNVVAADTLTQWQANPVILDD